VFTAYAWIAFYNRNPAYQVWARGITKKKDTHTLDFDVTLAFCFYDLIKI